MLSVAPARPPRNFSVEHSGVTLRPWGGALTGVDQIQRDCPGDVVDRLLWRNAQAILRRHVVRRDGTCQWCGHQAPCSPRQLAERADVVSRQDNAEAPPERSEPERRGLPHDAVASGNDRTRLLPLLSAESTVVRGVRGRNERSLDFRKR
jgi:hypothetical protein